MAGTLLWRHATLDVYSLMIIQTGLKQWILYQKSEADCERLVRQLQNDWIEYLGLIVKWAILVRRLNAVATRPSTRHRLKIIIVANTIMIICK